MALKFRILSQCLIRVVSVSVDDEGSSSNKENGPVKRYDRDHKFSNIAYIWKLILVLESGQNSNFYQTASLYTYVSIAMGPTYFVTENHTLWNGFTNAT